MKIPFLDLKTQYFAIKDEIGNAMQNVLDNTAFALGKSVSDFENSFANNHNVKNCIGVSSGTDGNHMVLWALGVGQGDEVIIPANTFVATAWGATLCGATPVFADVHPQSYNLDAENAVKAITPKTKAIVAVHLYGQPADMEAISYQLSVAGYQEEICGKFVNNETEQVIYLVEDCAQSHISEYKGKKVGGLGIASSFSFYPGKNLGAYGEGGAVCTNDEELAVRFKMIRDHGCKQKYVHEIYGHNYRMEGIQGAVLGVKLNYLEKWTEGRRRVAARYKELLKDCEQIILPKEMDYAKHVYHLYVVKVNKLESEKVSELGSEKVSKLESEKVSKLESEKVSKLVSEKVSKLVNEKVNEKGSDEVMKRGRDELAKYLNENGIATGLHYPIPLHLQPCFKHLGYKVGDMPVTEDLANNCLSLPMYAELTDEQIEYVAGKVIEYFKSS